MTTRQTSLVRSVLLAGATIVLALAGSPGRAMADTSTHTVAAEVAPDGTVGSAPVKARAGQAPANNANRLCAGHPVEYGNWVNADPNARGIARIELRDCQSVTNCSGNVCSVTYDAGWSMHVFGKCSPTNCDWGWSAARFRLSSGHIYGFYDQGFAKRHVYAKMSQYRPGQLWVYWRTDFADPNRADYEMQEWFVRV